VPRQLLWFMLVGALSTVLQTIVYVSVRELVAATWASWLALLVVTPANTEAHRRVTFNVTTTAIGRLHWEAGLTSVVVYVANLVISPWFAGIAGPHPSALTESLILALTGSLIGGVRYLILRSWVFAAGRHSPATTASAAATAPAGPPVVAVTAPAASSAAASSAAASSAVEPKLVAQVATSLALPAYPSTGNLAAALACLGTLAPIPTARLCVGHSNTGVLNQRPAGRLRTWHRNRRQHLTARS
jgi:hypothetical protein